MTRRAMEIDEILAVLRETPDRLTALTAGMDDTALRAAPSPGEWSAVAILAHLRACADVWGGVMDEIASHEHPTIRAINPRSWIEQTDYRELAFAPSLRAFKRRRRALLALLEPMRPTQWSRRATVTGGGAPLELTIQSYADRMARHERAHWRQLEQTLQAVRKRAPGPRDGDRSRTRR